MGKFGLTVIAIVVAAYVADQIAYQGYTPTRRLRCCGTCGTHSDFNLALHENTERLLLLRASFLGIGRIWGVGFPVGLL